MSAKEMFEELDMEQTKDKNIIEYHFKNDIDYPLGYYAYIYFDLEHKTYRTNLSNITKFDKAIKKQIEELRW